MKRQLNPIPKPTKIIARIYDVASYNDALSLYNSIDQQRSMKDSADTVHSIFRGNNFEPKSTLFKREFLRTAVEVAEGGGKQIKAKYLGDAIEKWLPQIRKLDAIVYEYSQTSTITHSVV